MSSDAPEGGPASGPLRLDYVSPLPPVRSGIADYSADLLPHLAERCDLQVIRLPDQPVAPEVEERWRPVAPTATGGRLPLYQMGNNPYHDAVLDLALARPGVVTLHDYVLHHLLLHRTLGRRDFEGYREALTAEYGDVGAAVCRPRYWRIEDEASLFALPANRRLLRSQRGVMVHNRWAAERILEEDPDLRVATVPMGVPLPPAADREAGRRFRERAGIPAQAPLLGSFGFQTPIKRTRVAVAALAAPELAEAHLLIVGEVSPTLDFEATARRAGVADRVHVAGFVDYSELEAAIAAVDLCLNLRYPTAGETSASLLRVLAMGRPAVVSDYAQFRELPAEVAVRVPLGEGETAALAATAARLLADDQRLGAAGDAARRYVADRHDPAAAAAAIVEACAAWRAAPLPVPLEELPAGRATPALRLRRRTSLVIEELPADLEVEGLESPWAPGTRRRIRLRLTNTGRVRWLAAAKGTGGLALEVALAGEPSGSSGRPPRPWLPLPRDVEPGESVELPCLLRRPVPAGGEGASPSTTGGPVQLTVAPRVLGIPGASTPNWRLELP